MTARHQRQAFTLVELLVVIAIIGILVALLLPAVQAAREAARRSSCVSNLKQMGLALHNYASANAERLPPGGITNGQCCSTPSGTNWAIEILPYLEEQPLYDLYDFDEANEATGDLDGDGLNNRQVVTTQVEVFLCASDQEVDFTLTPATGPGSGLDWARGSYRAVTGHALSAGGTPPTGYWDSHFRIRFTPELKGPLPTVAEKEKLSVTGKKLQDYVLAPTRMAEISDGTSNTLMVGERHSVQQQTTAACITESDVFAQTRQTLWAYTYTSYNKSQVTPTPGTLIPDSCQCAAVTGDAEACKRGWGSVHPGGLHFVLCDGSARFFSDDIDMELLADMASIGGEEIITDAF